MSYLADAHRDWHTVNGKYAVCPLDCGASEIVGNYFEADAEALLEVQAAGGRGIKCGNCKLHHTSVDAIRFCYQVRYDHDAHRPELLNA